MKKRMAAVVLAVVIALAFASCTAKQEPKTEDYKQTSLDGFKIVVDAGHGDTDVGTIGVSTGRYEKDVNLEIALKLKAALEAEGVEVVMTRESDEPIAAAQEADVKIRKEEDMKTRENIIRSANADMYLGVHQNRFEDEAVCGPQIFFLTNAAAGEKLAKEMQTSLNEELEIENPRSAISGNYRLLKPGEQPSVTVECGFFSNPEEEQKLQTTEYQDKVVAAIVDGVKRYVSTYSVTAKSVGA